MNNYEIENILIYNKNFLGCYASDQIDILPKTLPKSLIINTANSDTDGCFSTTKEKMLLF